MTAYYNEVDPFAAAWLRELIRVGLIAPGEVDERSIEDVVPVELDGFTQCHFFAGVGVWSYALRHAGWPDDRQVWTGSCPCQPFSAAGKGAGFADERHLWPAFFHLIEQCKPVAIIGEQVANKDALAWLDLVFSDLEGAGYTCGAVDTCAAGFGAPHIRQRLHWVANSTGSRCNGQVRGTESDTRDEARLCVSGEIVATGRLAQPESIGGREGYSDGTGMPERSGEEQGTVPVSIRGDGWLADSNGLGRRSARPRRDMEHQPVQSALRGDGKGEADGRDDDPGCGIITHPGPTNGHWRDVDWLFCRDGKWRPVRPGTFPLANGSPSRVGRLRGYGNAIVAPQATEIIRAIMEIERNK